MPYLLVFIFLLAGCGSKVARYERQPGEATRKSAIIFVPGYYGSALADDETGDRVFISTWSALFSSTPLANVTPDLGVAGARKLRSDGVLESLPVVPGIASVNIYGKALDFMRDKFGPQALVIPFDYDWRQELSQSARKLDALIKNLHAEGVSKVAIVAHSMGGLLATYYLRFGSQNPFHAVENDDSAKLISAVVIGGTPFSGSATAFRNLQTGTALGRSNQPLNALSLGTFGSMYELMPQPTAGVFKNSVGKTLGGEVMLPETWRRHRLGLYRKRGEVTPEVQTKRERFVAQALGQATAFHERLHSSCLGRMTSPPALYFVGQGRPTFSHAVWSQPTLNTPGRWFYDYETLKQALPTTSVQSQTEDGDSTVTVSSATPTKGVLSRLPGTIVNVDAEHEAILDDEIVQSRMEAFLQLHL